MAERFPETDWYCDRCGAYLNIQIGFNDRHYIWQCSECGHKNSISSDNIYESEKDFLNGHKNV
ncbi:MAG: Sec23/Sec24 zinc finger-containing protein [Oenococcus sp.]